jgi:hypothetical protein
LAQQIATPDRRTRAAFVSLLNTCTPREVFPGKSVTVKSGIDEKREIVTDDIDIFYCLVSDYLNEGGFYYFQEPHQALEDYGNDYKKAVYAARSERIDE